jgi:hypothetical protein
LRTRRRELLHDAGSLARHPPDLLNRSAKASELAFQISQRRLDPIAEHSPVVGKEEIAGGSSDNCPN